MLITSITKDKGDRYQVHVTLAGIRFESISVHTFEELKANLKLSGKQIKQLCGDKPTPVQYDVINLETAKAIMAGAGYIDCYWQLDDVLGRAIDRKIKMTREEAKEVVGHLERYHDANIGVNWEVIDIAIDDCFPKKAK